MNTVFFIDILSSHMDEIRYLNQEQRFKLFCFNLKILFEGFGKV